MPRVSCLPGISNERRGMIRNGKRGLSKRNMQERSIESHEIVGKQLTPIAMKNKNFTLKRFQAKKNLIRQVDSRSFSRKVEVKALNLSSDSSNEDFLTWDNISNLSPIYRYQPTLPIITLPKVSLPKVSQLKSILFHIPHIQSYCITPIDLINPN